MGGLAIVREDFEILLLFYLEIEVALEIGAVIKWRWGGGAGGGGRLAFNEKFINWGGGVVTNGNR